MIDNFELLNLMLPEKENCFYHLQIIQRGKDKKNSTAKNRAIKHYYIINYKDLLNLKEEIIKLCEIFKARAYINVAPKSFIKLTKLCNINFAKRILDNDYNKVYKIPSSVAGKLSGEYKIWVVDIDDPNMLDEVISTLIQINDDINIHTRKDNTFCIYKTIPTKHGYHLLTSPFNTKMFTKYFPNIDIHKNNPTLLYYPNSLK